MPSHCSLLATGGDPDWDFFLPDDGDSYPEPGDFWIEPTDDDD